MPKEPTLRNVAGDRGIDRQPLEVPVSVVIPTHNRAGVILKAIHSVLDQCQDRDEVIVVDDGSTDDTEAVISVVRERINYVRVSNGGAGRARNIGIDKARHDLVAFLDSDDEWVPGKLELQRAVFQRRPDLVLCTTNLALRYPPGEEEDKPTSMAFPFPGFLSRMMGPGRPYSTIAPLPEGIPDFQVFIGDLYRAQLLAPSIVADVVMVSRRKAGAAFRFPEDLPYHEDYECFSRIAREGSSAFLDWQAAGMSMDFGLQMTHKPLSIRLGATLTVLERVWGEDSAFLSRHEAEYREVMERLRRLRAWMLLCQGDTKEARRELSLMGRAPRWYRFFSHVPAPLASHLIWRCLPYPEDRRDT